MRFIARRCAHAVIMLGLVSFFSFLLLQLAPGSFFDDMRLDPQISPETIAHLQSRYGLNQPLGVRYLKWARGVARGDLGYSFAYNSPVGPLISSRARNTLLLAGTSTFLAWLLALPVGIWTAYRHDHWEDRVCSGASSILAAVPEMLLALGLLMFAVQSRALPAGGLNSVTADQLKGWARLQDSLRHMILPVTALVVGFFPTLVRHIRSAMMEALAAPFIQAVRAHGIGSQRLLWRHALPAALNPLITLGGISIATLLSGSLLVEVILSWPGMGPFFLEAIMSRDVYVIIATVLLSSAMLVAGNLAADVALFAADPRIRSK